MSKVQSVILFIIVLIGNRADGFTVSGTSYTTNGSSSDIQAAINAAPEGATVTIPAGSFNWGSSINTVSISGKGLTLAGAGSSSTTVNAQGTTYSSGGVLQVNTSGASASTRVTGIYFSGGWTVGVSGSPGDPVYRIDNCTFDGNSSPVNPVMLDLTGGGWGLIDHCIFTAGAAAEMIHDMAYGYQATGGWTNDVNPGSYQFVYIEDCTFVCTSSSPYNTGCGSFYGAQNVVRYCAFQYSKLDRHGDSTTPVNIGSRWYEVYNCDFNAEGNNQDAYLDLRDGSGVVFNLTSSGSNQGAGYIKVDEDSQTASYPVECQIGQGLGTPSTNLSPLYFWGLGPLTGNVGSASNVVQLNRDYFVSDTQPPNMQIRQRASDGNGSTYNYSPFTYPYPLTSTGMPNPAGSGPTPTPTPRPTPLAPAKMRFATPTP